MIRSIFTTVGFKGLLLFLLFAVTGKVTNSTSLFKLDRRDCKYPFWLRVPSSDVRIYEQIFAKQEYDFRTSVQPRVIVDAGANIGLASIYFANKYPDAKILAIEPEQSNFELLQKNTGPYANVIAIQAALWHKNEEINVVDPGVGKWGFRTEEKDSSGKLADGTCQVVASVTLDKIIDDYDLGRIDILKLDIEGAEKEVFSNTSSWIEKVDSIIIELHERMKSGCSRSFYCGSNGFDDEWQQGESTYLTRSNCLSRYPQ